MFAIAFIFLFIIGRLFVVQVVDGYSLQEKAVDQWTRELPVKAARGKILDVVGNVLAENVGTYAVFVRVRCVSDFSLVAEKLAEKLDLDKEKLYERLKSATSSEVTVARQVDKKTVQELAEYQLDGVYFAPDNARFYPYDDLLCQILGITSSDGEGVFGLEKYYDKYLKGVDGEFLYEADLVGKDIDGKTVNYIPATDGLNIRLNIDLEVQRICHAVMQKAQTEYTPKSASVIVVQPSSGKILGIATTPSFSLNSPDRSDMAAFNKMIRSPLIVDSYEPGSTFKTVTAIANIDEYLLGNDRAFSLEHVFNSSRFRTVGGRQIKCWSTHANGKHANERLSEALNNSCNPCFVDIALALGKEKMYEYIEKLNFGKVTGVDFMGEASGMVMPLSAVTDGDIARISFGQTIAVTPLQLAMSTSALINGGTYYTPYLVDRIESSSGEVIQIMPSKSKGRVVSKEASEILRGYLERVVAEGSGNKAYIEGYRVGGKTGTAQKYENGVIAQGKYVMSFIGFFPANEPEYLALCVVDEPVGGSYGSTVCAPLVKEIFEKIISAKNIQPVEIKEKDKKIN
ncbi:MAG: hypothetical protein IJ811_03145 [Clostridia bacterium]|nr:hypothetical protein [Clostridia bacterium]